MKIKLNSKVRLSEKFTSSIYGSMQGAKVSKIVFTVSSIKDMGHGVHKIGFGSKTTGIMHFSFYTQDIDTHVLPEITKSYNHPLTNMFARS